VARAQDIKRNAEIFGELVSLRLSWLDERFYERGVNRIFCFGADFGS